MIFPVVKSAKNIVTDAEQIIRSCLAGIVES
jgi:hypothetical protein